MRLKRPSKELLQRWFQFTHPVWGATLQSNQHRSMRRFNSRTPCGVRRLLDLLVEVRQLFQFTHPVWGATHLLDSVSVGEEVSIHAPRVGCDHRCLAGGSAPARFNSRTPCGVRLYLHHTTNTIQLCFNSRTPCGVRLSRHLRHVRQRGFNSRTPCGVRHARHEVTTQSDVSIHAPRVGCDLLYLCH